MHHPDKLDGHKLWPPLWFVLATGATVSQKKKQKTTFLRWLWLLQQSSDRRTQLQGLLSPQPRPCVLVWRSVVFYTVTGRDEEIECVGVGVHMRTLWMGVNIKKKKIDGKCVWCDLFVVVYKCVCVCVHLSAACPQMWVNVSAYKSKPQYALVFIFIWLSLIYWYRLISFYKTGVLHWFWSSAVPKSQKYISKVTLI